MTHEDQPKAQDTALQPAPLAPIKIDLTPLGGFEEAIEALEEHRGLRALGVGDEPGHEQVREAQKACREVRTSVESTRKGLKDPILKVGREIDRIAKDLTARVREIEVPLQGQIDERKRHLERLEAERKRRRQEEIERREGLMRAVGAEWSATALAEMTAEEFEQRHEEARELFQRREDERKAKEAAEAAEREKERQEAQRAREEAKAERRKAKEAEEEVARLKAELAEAKKKEDPPASPDAGEPSSSSDDAARQTSSEDATAPSVSADDGITFPRAAELEALGAPVGPQAHLGNGAYVEAGGEGVYLSTPRADGKVDWLYLEQPEYRRLLGFVMRNLPGGWS